MASVLNAEGHEEDRISPRPPGMLRPPLSYLQEQLWFLDEWTAGSATYNSPYAVRLRGPLDVAALRDAVSAFAARHEAMRTTFAAEDGVPYQVVMPPTEVELPIDDLSSVPSRERDAVALRVTTQECSKGFDLVEGPLFRVRLFRFAPDDHALAVTWHHIVSDGVTLRVFSTELSELYTAIREGRSPSLPPLEIQYADFALWQRERLQGGVLQEQLAYWKQRLEDLPILNMPADRPRPAVPSYRSDVATGRIGTELYERLRELCRSEGVTLFMLLISAFDALLARYTGQEDIVVGSTVSGRIRPEIESLTGYFVNMIVLRNDLSNDPAFRELLQRSRNMCLEAWKNQEAPFEKVVQHVQPERDPSRNPLFQIGLQLLGTTTSGTAPSLPGLEVELLDMHLGRYPFDLAVTATKGADGVKIVVDYATDLFDRPRIERMLRHYQQVLEAVAERPELRLSELPVLTEGERRQVLVDWQGQRRPYREAPVHALIAEQASRTPKAPAATFCGQVLTYAELEGRADSLARYLRGMGVGPEDVVGIALDRGFDQLCAIYATLKAGAAFVPLELSHPLKRLAYILSDTSAKAVLTSSRAALALPPAKGWRPVALDVARSEIEAARGSEPLEEWATASSLAYVLYTSGSTGVPKGVLIEHGAISNFCSWLAGVFGIGPGDRMLQFVSLVFDLAEGEIFTALSTGATLVLVPRETLLSPTAMAEVIERERVSYVGAPPTMLSVVSPGPYPDLRAVLVGGEVCPPELVNRWNTEGRTFVNGYGPTEATIGCIAQVCAHATHRFQPPIGRAMPNRVAYVLDRWGNPCPVGVPGEVLTGGVGLARGYLGRPELTAERFVPDPFAPEAGARLYRTGDLGRWGEDGAIQFLGRMDTQVKLRGQRIELEEVEAALCSHPGVAQAAVVLRQDTPGERRLVGYVVPADGKAPSVSELRRHLSADLPAYMVPAAFLQLESLPLLATGKVDRSALPAPEQARPQIASTYLEPRTEAERAVAGVFCDVLGIERAGAEDNFFELGGSSLQAGQVVSRLREAFGTKLSVREFYASPAVAEVAALVQRSYPREPAEDGELLSRIEELSEEEAERLRGAGG